MQASFKQQLEAELNDREERYAEANAQRYVLCLHMSGGTPKDAQCVLAGTRSST